MIQPEKKAVYSLIEAGLTVLRQQFVSAQAIENCIASLKEETERMNEDEAGI